MAFKWLLKRAIRSAGYEVRRYAPETSQQARFVAILEHHGIDLVIDVGANTGQYASMLRASGYHGRILSVEPILAAHARLVEASRQDGRWSVAEPMAIGDFDGETTIHVSDNLYSSSLLAVDESSESFSEGIRTVRDEQVQVRRLETVLPDWLRDGERVFLKVDVQGLEAAVLRGAAAVASRIAGLQLEMSLCPTYVGQVPMWDLMRQVVEMGWHPKAVFPGYSDIKTGQVYECDMLFFR